APRSETSRQVPGETPASLAPRMLRPQSARRIVRLLQAPVRVRSSKPAYWAGGNQIRSAARPHPCTEQLSPLPGTRGRSPWFRSVRPFPCAPSQFPRTALPPDRSAFVRAIMTLARSGFELRLPHQPRLENVDLTD